MDDIQVSTQENPKILPVAFCNLPRPAGQIHFLSGSTATTSANPLTQLGLDYRAYTTPHGRVFPRLPQVPREPLGDGMPNSGETGERRPGENFALEPNFPIQTPKPG